MLKKFNDITGTLYAGVEVVFLSRTGFSCNITLCRQKKGKIEIVEQLGQLEFSDAKKWLKKAVKIHLLITGKPVIFKKLSKFYENPNELTAALLPDARANDFVSQCSALENTFYGTAIRKETLYDVLKQFNEAGFFPETILFGPAVIGLLPTILEKDISLSTLVYSISVFEKKAVFSSASDPSDEIISLGGDQVHVFNLPSLCLCISSQLQQPVFSDTGDPEVRKNHKESVQKKRFKTTASLVVILLFVISATNFFVNRFYSEKFNTLEEKIAMDRQVLNEIERLEKDVSEKKLLLGNHPASGEPVISLVADRIGSTVPPGIRLSSFDVFPIESKMSKDKPISFSFIKAVVEGSTSRSETLDEWISRCRTFEWVKDVLIVKYNFDREKKKGLFKLEFLLR